MATDCRHFWPINNNTQKPSRSLQHFYHCGANTKWFSVLWEGIGKASTALGVSDTAALILTAVSHWEESLLLTLGVTAFCQNYRGHGDATAAIACLGVVSA